MNGFFTGNFIKKIKFYSTDQRNVSMYFYFQPANWNWNLDQVGQYLQFSNQYQSDQDWFGWIKGSDSSWMVFIGIQFQQCYLIMKTIAKVKKKKNYTKIINMSKYAEVNLQLGSQSLHRITLRQKRSDQFWNLILVLNMVLIPTKMF